MMRIYKYKSTFLTILVCMMGIFSKSTAQNVMASIFCETFDGTGDIGGNDGVFSSYGAISFPIRFDNDGWKMKKINGGANCIRLGNSSGSLFSYITTPAIPVNAGNLTLSFDAALWNTCKYSTLNIKKTLDGNNSNWKNIAITKGSFSTIQKQFSAITSGSLNLTFDNALTTSKNSYFFIDNIIVYQDNASDEQQQKAQRIILSGNFTQKDVNSFNKNLSKNFSIVSIDARQAVFPVGTTLTTGNKNCIIYATQASNVTNIENVVIDGKCENFKLYDGNTNISYPFCAVEDFTACNASYDRNFPSISEDRFYSVCLPFNFTASSGIRTIYKCSDYQNPFLKFIKTTNADGNTPTLISVTESQPFLSMENVTVKKTSSNVVCLKNTASACGVYRFHDNIVSDQETSAFGYSNGQFLKVTQTGYFKPFRVFFSILNINISSIAAPSAKLEVPEGIRTAQFDKCANNIIYSTNGRIVHNENLPSGIYIIHHKKHYIKR